MSADDYVRARIDPRIKNEAANVLSTFGLTVSDACRMMLTKIAREKRLPFGTEEPNELTRKTLEMADRGEDVFHAKDVDDLFRQLRI
ncbi:MAG: type II toxin-antitoxin system RelB/DinJ family antitoxin [Candidatus Adiutrix sp.]|jgi:DNA-damage-inducible protein J|nr:type II toxin-antitoxin system RelB/DinJ family antitoxin [Candidatus Adiutrix sp.]